MALNRLYHKSIFSMNTALDILIPDVDEMHGDRIMKKITDSAIETESRLSRFDPDAEVFKVNHTAVKDYIQVSDLLWENLLECRRYFQLTNGLFDIGLGIFKDTGKDQILKENSSATGIGINCIEFNERDHSVKFRNEYTSLDFGGIGKGILLRETNKILDQTDIENCFISFGGSSLLTKGSHPYGDSWPVGLRGAEDSGIVFHLNSHAASFSGTFRDESGSSILHIINPESKQPVSGNRISFVRSPDPVDCEVLSTVLLISPKEKLDEILSGFSSTIAYIFSKSNNQVVSQDYRYGE